MELEKWLQKKHCKKHTTKKTKPKHRKYTKYMYNYSIAMKLPFVPASPLLPLLLLPTIVGSPVPLTLPNTLKDLLEQRGVASPVCKCTKKCAHTYLPVFPNLHDPPHSLFFFCLFFGLVQAPNPMSSLLHTYTVAEHFYSTDNHCTAECCRAPPVLHFTLLP
jgi:hypothetical protein